MPILLKNIDLSRFEETALDNNSVTAKGTRTLNIRLEDDNFTIKLQLFDYL